MSRQNDNFFASELQRTANDLRSAGESVAVPASDLYERKAREIAFLSARYPAIEFPGKLRPLGEGNEHLVFFDEASNRVFKRTKGTAYGVTLDDDYDMDIVTQSYAGYLRFREALPSEYCERLILTNTHFGDDVEFVGISINGGHPAIVTSQKFIKGVDPTPEEVWEFMTECGFRRVSKKLIRSRTVGNNTWYRMTDGLLVLDAKPANFKKGKDDNLFPIDLPIRHFRENEWLMLQVD